MTEGVFDDIKGISPEEFRRVVDGLNTKRPFDTTHRGASPAVLEAKLRLEAERERAEAARKLQAPRMSDIEYDAQITELQILKEEARRYREAEAVAQAFHETYERLAPDFGYKTREQSAVPWSEVPDDNKRLMIATARCLLSSRVIVVP